jgi:dTDP-glucose 4,6-dehydratase
VEKGAEGLKLLVTGGAGFIGSNFIRYFLRTHPDAHIVNLDKLTYAGNLDNLSEIETHSNYTFVRGDVADSELVSNILSPSIDAIVHFAAETHVDRSIVDAQAFVRTNVLGTYTLLDAAKRNRIGRFLHISTDEVYGSLELDASANEQSQIQPNSPYAASKAASDMFARSFWQTYQFPVIITRCSNNYGPYQFPEKLIPLMITHALHDKKLPVYGDGFNERDWLFVEDHCRAIERVLEGGRPGEVYNIGFGRPVKNLEVVRLLLQIMKKSEELIEFVPDRPGHDRRYALDTRKIRAELGWEPIVGLEQGLARTVEWYRSHADWVERTQSGEYLAHYDKFYNNRDATLAQL